MEHLWPIPGPPGRKGSVIFLVIVFIASLALVGVAMQWLQVMNKSSMHQRNQFAQGDNIARAGLTDAMSWFKRQSCQPVRQTSCGGYTYPDMAFFPRVASGDTIDEGIGLVHEYPITSDSFLWARYEVRRSCVAPNSPTYASLAVHDVSPLRIQGANAGDGLVWQISSIGYVYRKLNGSVPYNQSPNQIVSQAAATTEIRRVGISLPANAAAITVNASNVSLTNGSRLLGGSNIGLLYNTGTVPAGSAPYVIPNSNNSGPNPIDPQSIFSVTPADLKLVADYLFPSGAILPPTLPTMAIVYIDGNASFDTTHQLIGSGILYVNGNLTVASNPNTLFSGVIFVTGNVNITGPASISGSLIAQGSLTLATGSDISEVTYDGNIINTVRQQVTQYRENKSVRYSFKQL